jgi:tetratricopeptide (TPR) repeat protein
MFAMAEEILEIHKHEDFRQGLSFFEAGNFEVASVFFSELLETEAFIEEDVSICRSWNGLSKALDGDREGVVDCRIAVQIDRPSLQAYLNLARAELEVGNVEKLLIALEKGISLYPNSRKLRDLYDRYDRRGPPPISFLSRDNPLNRLLGQIRRNRRLNKAS